MNLKLRFLLTSCCLACLTLQAEALWPQFRGPNAAGLADGARPPIHFGPGSNCLWKVDLPDGASSPCIWGDRIFLTDFNEGKLETRCLQRSDGHLLWHRTAPVEQLEKYHAQEGSPAASTPVADAQRVYVYFGSCGLICYDNAGEEKWRFTMPPAVTSGDFGSGASPILSGNLVIVNRDQNTNSFLLAVDKRTGREVWRADRPGFISSYGTPIVWSHDNQREIVLPGFLQLKAYDAKSGEERWSVAGLPTAVCTTPVLGDGLLFFAGWSPGQNDAPMPDFKVLAKDNDKDGDGIIGFEEATEMIRSFFSSFDMNHDNRLTSEEWDTFRRLLARGQNALLAVKPGGKGDVTDTHVAWKQTKGLPYVPSPLYYRGRVYLLKDGGMVSCFNATTGEPVYQQERIGPPGTYYASPVAADGRIYIISASGAMTVFAAGDTPEKLAQQSIEERAVATPAIVEDKIYLRTSKRLWAFGSKN